MIKTMTEFLIRKPSNYVEKNTRNKLANYFMQRITGNDFNYAKFCVFYCSQVRNKMEYLDRAESICIIYEEKESYELLQMLYRMKIKIVGHTYHISCIDNKAENDLRAFIEKRRGKNGKS